ncbi:MAG: penicillin-binding protein 2 [Pseudomonadaceae bacterium]|nr:penicillin-binding protein 2 [Pseudomonadaceae bacterium]
MGSPDTSNRTLLNRLVSSLKAWRYGLVLFVFGAAFLGVIARLISLQVVDPEFLRNQGDARTVRIETIDAHRGMIVDRNGEPLAVSTPVETLWANPSLVDVQHPEFGRMAALLGMDVRDLRARIESNRSREFLYLKRKAQPALATQIKALRIPGIDSRREYRRYYPAGEVAAHVVGFTNIDEAGQEGMELAFDHWLTGVPGRKRVLKDRNNRMIKDLSLIQDAAPGKEVRLSIDLRLQYLAYRELKAAVTAHRARGGTLVMLDVDTGEVLAMVNQPSYNPNNRSTREPSSMRNRAITDLFEPGSTVKPLTVALALESGRYTATTEIDTSPGYIRVGGFTIRDHRNYGILDLTGIIAKSSNVGTSRIALDLSGERVQEMFSRLGFGQSTGIGFPGEAIGVLPARVKWRPAEVAALSYGYGMSVNALQLTQAYMALANGGVRYPSTLLRQDTQPVGERVMSEPVALSVQNMLRAVVEEGTGKRAQLGIYQSAGKTGTVHLVGANGYEASQYKSIFAGLAPADRPRVACVVIVDAPQGNQYFGGEVAAPIFSRVVGDALRLLNVRPAKNVRTVDMPVAGSQAQWLAGGPKQ